MAGAEAVWHGIVMEGKKLFVNDLGDQGRCSDLQNTFARSEAGGFEDHGGTRDHGL